MSSGALLTHEQRVFQLRLIFGFFFLVSLLFLGVEVQFAICAKPAQAFVVGVEDVYDSRGVRLPGHRINYQYGDSEAKIVRRESYWLPMGSPTPPLGQAIAVDYLPNVVHSSHLAGDGHPLLWATIAPLVIGGLLVLSACRR